MFSTDQVSAKIKQVGHNSMRSNESLGLPQRLEIPHTSLPYSGQLMRLLSAIVLILRGAVDRVSGELQVHTPYQQVSCSALVWKFGLENRLGFFHLPQPAP